MISYYEFNEAKARIPLNYYHNGVIPPNLPRPRNIEPVFRCIPRRVDARGRAEYESPQTNPVPRNIEPVFRCIPLGVDALGRAE